MNAIYARQSIEKKDSLSIEAQIKLCRTEAGGDARIFQDKGYSGKNTKRPAFTELMNAVEAGEIKKIFVYKLDRFSRSVADFGRLWEILERHAVEFVSITEKFDTSSPIGRAMLNIVLVFAQLERETTAERVKDNYIHRFRLGVWTGGPAPYGFDLTKITSDGRQVSSLAANEHADNVKKIFEEYAKPETTLRSLAKYLTEQKIHGPRRAAWDNVTLSRILHSPLYVKANEEIYWYYIEQGMNIQQEPDAFDGLHACNVIGRRDRSRNKYNPPGGQMLTMANHIGFIEPALWLKVQDKLSKNAQISKANAGKYSWLTGLMKCGKCGYAVKINYSKSENKLYLLCSGRSNFGACDASIHIELRELEEYISSQISEMLNSSPPDNLPNSEELSEEILSVEQRIERLVGALSESSEISASYISKQIDFLHKERDELLKKSKCEQKKINNLDFNTSGFEEKKVIAREFIERIVLNENNVNIIWKI